MAGIEERGILEQETGDVWPAREGLAAGVGGGTGAYVEHWVPRGEHAIYAREYPGEGPAILLLHGFPDNLHLYDLVAPRLAAAGRRVVVFDFLGWGRSGKPEGYPYTADNQARDLAVVVEHLSLDEIVPVAHDASGPPAIDWALWYPERTAALVLLNTYYGHMPSARLPEAIRLFPTSELYLLPTAQHFPQLDEPEEVARLILSTPLSGLAGDTVPGP